MTISAGALRSRISQGSPTALANALRPMISPAATPTAIAIRKAAATRASVIDQMIGKLAARDLPPGEGEDRDRIGAEPWTECQ